MIHLIIIMTRLMERAIERLRAVPEAQQEQVARFLLNELDDQERWAQPKAAQGAGLSCLAEQIVIDDAKGLCEPLDLDSL